MHACLQLSTVGELRRRLEELAGAGVPDESTLVIHREGFEDMAAMEYSVYEDFQPADQHDAGIEEPPGYWTVIISLEVAAPVPHNS